MQNAQTQPTYTFSRRLTKLLHPLYAIPLAIFILPLFLVPTMGILTSMSGVEVLFGLLIIAFLLLLTFTVVYGMLGYTQDLTYTFDATNAVCAATMSRNLGNVNRTLLIMGKIAHLFSAKTSRVSAIRNIDTSTKSFDIEWSSVRQIKAKPRYHYIKLIRTTGLLSEQIFCTKDNYTEVLSVVTQYVAKNATAL